MHGPATSLCKDYSHTSHLEEKQSSQPLFLNCSSPHHPLVASAHEMEVLRHMSLNRTSLEQLSTSISSDHIEAGINTHFHLHASSLQHASKSDWIALGLIVAGVVLTLFIFHSFTHSYIWNLVKLCIVDCDNMAENGVQKPQAENPSPSHPNTTSADCEDLTDATPQMRHSVYLLQSA